MYIFLDCDGVINQLQPNYYIDIKCIEALSELVKGCNGKIILISTWRYGYMHNYKLCTPQVQNLLDMLNEYNIKCLGRTRNLHNRQIEIIDYLKEHEKDTYIILDDDESLYDNIPMLYIVNHRTGLTKNDIKIIRSTLCI